MPTRPPKFLYFDLGNVVLPFDYLSAVRQMADVAGVSEQVIQEVVFDSGLEPAYERGDMTTEQFFEMICRRLGTRPDFDAFVVAASDMFWENPAVVDLILRLRRAGHRTGVLSNTCEAHWQFCRERRFPVLQQLFEPRRGRDRLHRQAMQVRRAVLNIRSAFACGRKMRTLPSLQRNALRPSNASWPQCRQEAAMCIFRYGSVTSSPASHAPSRHTCRMWQCVSMYLKPKLVQSMFCMSVRPCMLPAPLADRLIRSDILPDPPQVASPAVRLSNRQRSREERRR